MKDEIHAVTWRDACSLDSWRDIEAARESVPIVCRTVGWLVAWDDDRLVLAISLCPSNGQVSGTCTIPVENILEHHILT